MLSELERAAARVLCFVQDCKHPVVYEDSVLMTNPLSLADLQMLLKAVEEGTTTQSERKKWRK